MPQKFTNKVKKTIEIVMSKKFPDGSLLSVKLGTEIEEENIDPDELFDKVTKSAFSDIDKSSKNKIIRAVLSGTSRGIKKLEKLGEL